MLDIRSYRGNSNLKRPGEAIEWTPEMVEEYKKCSQDPKYFIENYMKIIHVDRGKITMELRSYQHELVDSMINNRFTLACMARQSGKTVSYVAFCLWYILFTNHKTIGIMANKGDTARSILGRVRLAYENLPKWLQHGVLEWNKGSIELENGSKLVACSTSSSTARGESFSVVIIDEMAFVENWDEFYASVYPTISSGTETKIVGVSTPNGLNFFYRFYVGAKAKGKDWNGFNLVQCTWKDVPGRDEKWKEQTIRQMNGDREKFDQEFNCEFIGSSGTLIAGWKLKELVFFEPEYYSEGLSIYELPKEGHTYVAIFDSAEGKSLDYSAGQVIDITEMPYKQVASYNCNTITPIDFAEIMYRIGKKYNDAFVLCENNAIGSNVVNFIYFEYEYENLLYTVNAGRAGKKISGGFGGGAKAEAGVNTSKTVKAIGCSILKMLIEQNQLIIYDHETIHELSVFVKDKGTYNADSGEHDDLVMCLVLFAWLTDDSFFKELSDINTLNTLRNNKNSLDDILPAPVVVDGITDSGAEEKIQDSDGTWWERVDSFSSIF